MRATATATAALLVILSCSFTRAAKGDEPIQPAQPNRPSPKMDEPDPPTPRPANPRHIDSGLPTSRDAGDSGVEDEESSGPADLVQTPHEWKVKYEAARAKLVAGDFADAAVSFAELESSAVNRVDRALARSQRVLADDWASHGMMLTHRSNLLSDALASSSPSGVEAVPPPRPDRRTTDELTLLYANSIVYGIGSAVWLSTLTEPSTTAGEILPGFALTAASIGTVIALDSGKQGMRYGIPQSIVSGAYIGLEHGIVWSLFANARDRTYYGDDGEIAPRPLSNKTVATVIWSFTTAGMLGGGLLGDVLNTTPGRSSWVGSTALWTGAFLGFGVGGIADHGTTAALAVAGVGLSLGTGVGLATAGAVSPSVARVRLMDLSGALGGVTGAVVYAASQKDSDGQDGRLASGITAIGIATGLGVGWFVTSGMQGETLRSRDTRESLNKQPAASLLSRTRPMLLPVDRGATLGLVGLLD